MTRPHYAPGVSSVQPRPRARPATAAPDQRGAAKPGCRCGADSRRITMFSTPPSARLIIGLAAFMAACADGDENQCDAQGTHSSVGAHGCECDPGYQWEDGNDPRNYKCVRATQSSCCVGRECGWDVTCNRACGTCD